MNRRSMRNNIAQSKDPAGSSREKKFEVTSRPPIKNQRKRTAAAVSDYGPGSESAEPPKKSPKGAVSDYGPGSESAEPPEKSPKGAVSESAEPPEKSPKGAVSDYGPGSESAEPPKKSPKGAVSDYGPGSESAEPPEKSPKGAVSDYGPGSESAEPPEKSPKEPEKMDCSDDTNLERESPDGNQPEKNTDFTVSPQTPADEDMDSEPEMEADGFQDPSGPLTNQTFSDPFPLAGNTQRVPDRQPNQLFSGPAQAVNRQYSSYREPKNDTDTKQSAKSVRPSVPDPFPSAGNTQRMARKKPLPPFSGSAQDPFPSAGNTQRMARKKPPPIFSGSEQANIRYWELQNDTYAKQSAKSVRPSVSGSKSFFWKLAIPIMGLIAVLSACIFCLWSPEATAQRALKEREELLLGKWEEIQTRFPNQRQELWVRSSVLLKKHVGAAKHTQPVILMFAADRAAKETMRCLAGGIAGAYATAFNSSVVEIDGSSKKSLSSDKVKLDLDNQLSSEFSEGRKAAVIHHFQDLPPPSTLLFYKYCDHENAAFKDVSLLITVLLDEPMSTLDLPLPVVEEKVYDFLKKKLCSDEPEASNDMNTDKLSGLWSRISHLVLPVKPEKEIEAKGCPV